MLAPPWWISSTSSLITHCKPSLWQGIVSMTMKYFWRDGNLLWIRNPFGYATAVYRCMMTRKSVRLLYVVAWWQEGLSDCCMWLHGDRKVCQTAVCGSMVTGMSVILLYVGACWQGGVSYSCMWVYVDNYGGTAWYNSYTSFHLYLWLAKPAWQASFENTSHHVSITRNGTCLCADCTFDSPSAMICLLIWIIETVQSYSVWRCDKGPWHVSYWTDWCKDMPLSDTGHWNLHYVWVSSF